MLLVVGGLPGTGKSTIIDRLARHLSLPVLAKDWIEASLWRCEIGTEQKSGWIAYQLMTFLAEAQLRHGNGVILDSVATSERLRQGWYELADRCAANFIAIECICSDEHLHRSRLEPRDRSIPGWPELSWEQVQEVRSRYEPWRTERLVLDSVKPLEENVSLAKDYLARQRHQTL
jgi:predicted kinase